MNRHMCMAAALAASFATAAVADDRAEYNRRSAERYIAMFRMLDIDKDDIVSLGEAKGTIELEARFNDIDVDRDGKLTWNELERYIEATFR